MSDRDQSFGKKRRLSDKESIDAVFAANLKVSSKGITLRYLNKEVGEARILVISGKRWGNAVERNRIRRIVRESFRKWSVPEGLRPDIVVSQYRSMKAVPGCQIARVIEGLFEKIRSH